MRTNLILCVTHTHTQGVSLKGREGDWVWGGSEVSLGPLHSHKALSVPWSTGLHRLSWSYKHTQRNRECTHIQHNVTYCICIYFFLFTLKRDTGTNVPISRRLHSFPLGTLRDWLVSEQVNCVQLLCAEMIWRFSDFILAVQHPGMTKRQRATRRDPGQTCP
jgi:hypothetical protein